MLLAQHLNANLRTEPRPLLKFEERVSTPQMGVYVLAKAITGRVKARNERESQSKPVTSQQGARQSLSNNFDILICFNKMSTGELVEPDLYVPIHRDTFSVV